MAEGEVSPQIPPEEKSPESDSEKEYSERSAAFEKIDSTPDDELRQKGAELGIEGPTSKIREALKTEWDEAYEEKAQAAREHIESQRAQVAGPGLPEGAAKAYEEAVAVAKHRAEAVRLFEAAKAPLKERAAETGKKKAGEVVQFAREKGPVVKEKARVAAEKFSLAIEEVIVRATPKMEALIERGKKVLGKVKETDPREALASLIDLPANFTDLIANYVEEVARKREEKARKLEKKVEERREERQKLEDALDEKDKGLVEASRDLRKVDWARMMSRNKEVEAKLKSEQDQIEKDYGESYKRSPKTAEKRQKKLDALRSRSDEQKAKLREEREAFLARENSDLEKARERLGRKYGRRIGKAAERTSETRERASKAREEASEAAGFRETWQARARKMRRTSDAVVAFLGA